MVCMPLTADIDAASSYVFWRGIAEDDGLRRGDPRKTLLDLFKKTSAGGHRPDEKRNMTDRAFIKHISLAWNAHYEDRKMQSFRINDTKDTSEIKFSGGITIDGRTI